MAKIKQRRLKTKWYHLVLVKFSGLIVFVFFIIMLSISYFSFFKSKLADARDNGPLDVSYYQGILDEQNVYLEKLKELKSKSDKIDQAEMKKLDYVLANEAYIPSILNQINVLAERSNLELTGFNIDFGEGVINLSLNFENGTYQKMKKFIRQIETNIRIMDIDKLSFEDVGNIIHLNIKTYYLDTYDK